MKWALSKGGTQVAYFSTGKIKSVLQERGVQGPVGAPPVPPFKIQIFVLEGPRYLFEK